MYFEPGENQGNHYILEIYCIVFIDETVYEK